MTEKEMREKLVGKILISYHKEDGFHYNKIIKVGDLCDGVYCLELEGDKDAAFITPNQLQKFSDKNSLFLRDITYVVADKYHDEATATQSTVMQDGTDWEERTYTLSEQLFLQGRKAIDAIHTAQEFIKAYKEKMEGEV